MAQNPLSFWEPALGERARGAAASPLYAAMAFALKHEKPIAKTVPRIIRKEIKKAIKEVAAHRGSSKERVHEARTHLKKARAALRLLDGNIRRRQFRRVNKSCREPAKALAKVRDAQVLEDTLDTLLRGDSRRIFLPFRRRLHTFSVRTTRAPGSAVHPQQEQRLLKRAHDRAAGLHPRGRGWEAIKDGLIEAYACARKAHRQALATPSEAAFHEWRKQTKYLRYEVELLDSGLNDLVQQLHRLTDALGEDHDLAVLSKTLDDKAFADLDPKALCTLKARITRRQRGLRLRSKRMGQQMFAASPQAFVARLHRDWKTVRAA